MVAPLATLAEANFGFIEKGGNLPTLAQQYDGPYRVISRRPKSFLVEVGGQQDVMSVDRLQPHLGQQPLPALPLK